jgi:hypothetical protein
MPVNEGRLPTKVEYIGLKDRQYAIRDTDRTSRDFFGIVEMPNVFTAGKNLFKIKAHPSNLVSKSPIYIEILDQAGNTIYYKPLRYLEKDGTRVIAVYVYPDTAPGPCTVYLASRAALNPETNQPIPFSRDFQDEDYFEYPNVLWSTSVGVAPSARNDTEIIITKKPRITLSEVVQPYYQPVTITGVLTDATSSADTPSDAVGITLLATPTFDSPPPPLPTARADFGGGGSNNSPAPGVGDQFLDVSAVDDSLNNSDNTETGAPPLYTLSGNNIVEINSANDFRFTYHHIGGVLTIKNPIITLEDINDSTYKGFTLDGVEYFLPANKPFPDGASGAGFIEPGTKPLYVTLKFAIVNIINGTRARVAQFAGLGAGVNQLGNILYGDQFGELKIWVEGLAYDGDLDFEKIVTSLDSTYNFTASFIAPDEVIQTENFQSFADIILSDIEPDTGDVFKVKTLYKPSGMFGDFIDLGDTILEEQQILIDTGSVETNILVGTQYENYGQFEDLEEIYKYWDFEYFGIDSNVSGTPPLGPKQRVTASYDDTVIIGGAKIERQRENPGVPGDFSLQTNYEIGHSSVFNIRPLYRPKLFKDTEYKLRGRVGLHTGSNAGMAVSDDPRIQFPRLDIYISGSSITKTGFSDIVALGETSIHPEFYDTVTTVFSGSRRGMDVNPYTTGLGNIAYEAAIYADNNILGTRIGTLLLPEQPNLNTVFEFRFKPNDDIEKANINFVIRSGEWTIGQLELVSHVETGFSPNYVRIGKRVPSEHLNTPLTFKFQLFDYRGNLADNTPVAYGATFLGENQYINGTSNVVTGSIFIGNAIGAGLELAGVNSAFLRSIGYSGYSASLANDNGKNGGFLIYSGSIFPDELNHYGNEPYKGVGFELVADDDSGHFIFHTNPSILDIKAQSFFIGNPETQFISGANENIEISSSLFHLQPDGQLTINSVLEANNIFVPAGSSEGEAEAPLPKVDNLAFISSSGLAKFAGNDSDSNYKVIFDPEGDSSIAGWTIGDDRLSGGNLIFDKSGIIQTTDYVSNFSGFILSAVSGGFLEVENAKIRGTLSTAVFEKESVNAVGGQLYVANSTTLTGSGQLADDFAPPGQVRATDTTMSVVNASGFAVGEILTAKKVTSTGFATEYLYVNSSSRTDRNSDTDFSGKIYVVRGYGNSTEGNSGSLGDSPSVAQAYSGSQVIVSTGKLGTGYIRLNANPNDPTTPYMDVVERTGSGLYDVSLKARLGDLSGLANTDYVFGNANPGFGLATDNVFLQGGIQATFGTIGGFSITDNAISSSNNSLVLHADGGVTASDAFFNGDVVAASFAETFINIEDASDAATYFQQYGAPARIRLIFDGSTGGSVARVMQISYAPDYPIGDIRVPKQGAGISNEVQVVISVNGVQFDNSSISGKYSDQFQEGALE